MHKVLLLGAGKIGRMIAAFLSAAGDYDVLAGDIDEARLRRIDDRERISTMIIDAASPAAVERALEGRSVLISALSYHHNAALAETAAVNGASYFDVTEDVETARRIRAVAAGARAGQIFMPQCGLAPGFVAILAFHLTKSFDRLDAVRMRVGALPRFPSNALRYNLTWSTDGLINEYCNPCDAIRGGRRVELPPLENLEHFWLDGVQYEAFNTSGGAGTLAETLDGKVRELDYKTIRYPGHRDLMSFLVNDLRLSERRDLLKDVLERAIPATFQDVVVVFCTASGWRNGQFVQISDSRTIRSGMLFGEAWSAIQISTAAGVCAAVDLALEGRLQASGFVRQEQIELEDFLANRFGSRYGGASQPPEVKAA